MEKQFRDSIISVQGELKAPKNQRNSFGNYNYRSAEDILEAVKPLLQKYSLLLYIEDKIVMIGDRYYVQATANISDGSESLSVTAFAREEDQKKGQDSSQITGSTSSYARKYALNGLFCIDDTKDSDATNTHGKDSAKASPPKKSELDSDMNQAKEAISKCKSTADLTEVWNAFKNLQGVPEFKTMMTAAKKKVK